MNPPKIWKHFGELPSRRYRCGHCGNDTGSYWGVNAEGLRASIYICSGCCGPTFFNDYHQIPAAPSGDQVRDLPDNIRGLYEEARTCLNVRAKSAVILLCRKILMHVAHEKGAKEGTFADHVRHLQSQGYVTPDSYAWVDHIRSKGNEANHEIAEVYHADAERLLAFTEHLLRHVFELPAKLKSALSED